MTDQQRPVNPRDLAQHLRGEARMLADQIQLEGHYAYPGPERRKKIMADAVPGVGHLALAYVTHPRLEFSPGPPENPRAMAYPASADTLQDVRPAMLILATLFGTEVRTILGTGDDIQSLIVQPAEDLAQALAVYQPLPTVEAAPTPIPALVTAVA